MPVSTTSQQKRLWAFDEVSGCIEASTASPTYEAQNIADLAVEKHFEKSLANFYAKQAAATASVEEASGKTSLDLRNPRSQPPFSPSSTISSSSTNSSSDGSLQLSPREEGVGGPSFNPKKKWLAQYDDDEGARSRLGRESLDDSSWNSKDTVTTNCLDKRSRSCPILIDTRPHSAEGISQCKLNRTSNSSVGLR